MLNRFRQTQSLLSPLVSAKPQIFPIKHKNLNAGYMFDRIVSRYTFEIKRQMYKAVAQRMIR